MTTFHERCVQTIDAIGGSQESIAAKIRERFGVPCSQQAIGNLYSPPPDKEPQSSRLTPYLAALAGYSPTWLASEVGERDIAPQLNAENMAGTIHSSPGHHIEVDGVEITRAALEVAKAFMALPEFERDDFKQRIETLALQYRSRVLDHKMESWRAPRVAKPGAAPTATRKGRKKPPAGKS